MNIEKYIKIISNLHSDTVPNRWPDYTKNRAPHKPLLLLSVMDLIEQGNINSNLIKINFDLIEVYNIYWNKIMPVELRNNIALPFFHLRYEKFWHLIPRKGKENILSNVNQMRSVYKLKDIIIGAKFDSELFQILKDLNNRNMFRLLIIEKYFSTEIQYILIEQGSINRAAFKYSKLLLDNTRKNIIKDDSIDDLQKDANSRDQGFRRAVVTAYDRRCALCGIRIITVDGHTVVDAAHIIPWNVGHNDSPKNGLALCRLCHWTFDEGLISVSLDYKVITSSQLSSNSNFPGHIVTLEGRSFIGPIENIFFPDHKALDWHFKNVFRKH